VYLSKKCQQSTISAFLANKQIHSRIHWLYIYALTSIGYRHFLESGCRRSRDSMVVGFRTKLTMPITTTVVRSSPAHGKLWFVKKFYVTCDRSVVFSGYSGFLHQSNVPPRYTWDIVKSACTNPEKRTVMYMCVWGRDFSSVFQIFLLNFGTVFSFYLRHCFCTYNNGNENDCINDKGQFDVTLFRKTKYHIEIPMTWAHFTSVLVS
jgi:hypothetical protein